MLEGGRTKKTTIARSSTLIVYLFLTVFNSYKFQQLQNCTTIVTDLFKSHVVL